MKGIRFIHLNSFNSFSGKKVSVSPTDTEFVYYTLSDDGKIVESEHMTGDPDVFYSDILFVKDTSLFYTHGKIKRLNDTDNFVQFEDFSPVARAALSSIEKGTLGTINGQSLEDGDVTLDLSLYKIVSELPTENILTNKIYLVPSEVSSTRDFFIEYIYNDTEDTPEWEILGTIQSDIDLSDYLKTADAEKKYVKKSENTNASINTDNKGALANFSDNGQAYLAVRPKTAKFLVNSPYVGAAFGVKDDGTAAFTHKIYSTYNKETGEYSGAKNTAVLQFAGPTGLRYAKNTGNNSDVTEDMYKYVGVIDSPDAKQKVYSAAQVDELLKTMNETISALEQRIQELEDKQNN